MSRHTPIKGVVSRSFGIEDETDTVVLLSEEGTVTVRKEPVRRLRKGEQCPEATVTVDALWETRERPLESKDELTKFVDNLVSRIPIADFGITDPKADYKVKAWLLKQLNHSR